MQKKGKKKQGKKTKAQLGMVKEWMITSFDISLD
jgi:hypothetical protein